jgi:hypothetical protein
MWPFLWNILEPILNLRTFGECLNIKKHVQILESLKKPCQQMLCITRNSNNIVKWLQIDGIPIS